MKRGGHLNVGPVNRVGQVETEHSSKTSLIQETEGENLPIEWDFRPLCGTVFSEPKPLDPLGAYSTPDHS